VSSGTIKLIIYANVPEDYGNVSDIDTTPPGARKKTFNDFYINSTSRCYVESPVYEGLQNNGSYFNLSIQTNVYSSYRGKVFVYRNFGTFGPSSPYPYDYGPFYV
jgi:hypothetical protein